MKFDDDSQKKIDIINDDNENNVNGRTKYIQEWCADNSENPMLNEMVITERR